jgi:hypothetical protein
MKTKVFKNKICSTLRSQSTQTSTHNEELGRAMVLSVVHTQPQTPLTLGVGAMGQI